MTIPFTRVCQNKREAPDLRYRIDIQSVASRLCRAFFEDRMTAAACGKVSDYTTFNRTNRSKNQNRLLQFGIAFLIGKAGNICGEIGICQGFMSKKFAD